MKLVLRIMLQAMLMTVSDHLIHKTVKNVYTLFEVLCMSATVLCMPCNLQ
jgi:hypothetical protein